MVLLAGLKYGAGIFPPIFVIKIDGKTSDVWVGEEKYLYSDRMKVVQTHFIDSIEPNERLKVKIRFQHKGVWARVLKTEEEKDGEFQIEFEEPVRAVTPGQAAVMYRENQLVGGGWII